jgi:ankyrin repeat protein
MSDQRQQKQEEKQREDELEFVSAAQRGNLNRIRQLLDQGINVNTVDKGGWTALCQAAYNGHKDILQLLLDRGAHTEKADPIGNTPLLTRVQRARPQGKGYCGRSGYAFGARGKL